MNTVDQTISKPEDCDVPWPDWAVLYIPVCDVFQQDDRVFVPNLCTHAVLCSNSERKSGEGAQLVCDIPPAAPATKY